MRYISLAPQLGNSFGLRVEFDSLFAIEMIVAQKAAAGAGEREHWQWHWNGYIHTDLSDIDLVYEFAGGGTVGCENSGTVTVRVFVDDVDGMIQGVGEQTHQNGAKDFLTIASH